MADRPRDDRRARSGVATGRPAPGRAGATPRRASERATPGRAAARRRAAAGRAAAATGRAGRARRVRWPSRWPAAGRSARRSDQGGSSAAPAARDGPQDQSRDPEARGPIGADQAGSEAGGHQARDRIGVVRGRDPADRSGPGSRPRPWERGPDERSDGPRDEPWRPSDQRPARDRGVGDRPATAPGRPAGLWTARGGPPGRRPLHRTAAAVAVALPIGRTARVPRRTVPADRVRAPLRRPAAAVGPRRRRRRSAPRRELVAGRRPVEEAFVARRPAHPAAGRPAAACTPSRSSCSTPRTCGSRSSRSKAGSLTALAGFDGHQGIALVVEPRQFATPGRHPRAGRRARRAAVHPGPRFARGPAQRRHAPAQRRGRRRARRALPDPSPGAAQPVRGEGVGRRDRAPAAMPGRRPARRAERPPHARPAHRRRRRGRAADRPSDRPAWPARDRRRAARARASGRRSPPRATCSCGSR